MYEVLANISGHFTRQQAPADETMTAAGWRRDDFDDAAIKELKSVFYPEFVAFCCRGSHGCDTWCKTFDADRVLTLKGRDYHYRLQDVHFFFMPLAITMFSVQIAMRVEDPNDATAVLSSLRLERFFKQNVGQESIAISAVKEVYGFCNPAKTAGEFAALVENGNKFRIFQIYNRVSSAPADDDLLLYQLASVSRVTQGKDLYSVTPAYLERTLNEHRVAVFCNWQALALMDTFTILSYDAETWQVDYWQKCYFRMIYLHSLFEKVFLFNLNKQFHEMIGDGFSVQDGLRMALSMWPKRMAKLLKSMEYFEQWCCFHKISYNFLPLEIDDAIDRGLCVSEEQSQLQALLVREKDRRKAASDRIENVLLFVLSLMTLFSSVLDLSCLIDRMYPYAGYLGTTEIGYRTVTLLFLLILLIVVQRFLRTRR